MGERRAGAAVMRPDKLPGWSAAEPTRSPPRRPGVRGPAGRACRPITVGGGTGSDRGPNVAINQIQVLASHNSYHVEPEPALLTALRSVIGAAADGFEYTHRPLADELDAGVRQVELDVFVDDPGGGRYAHPSWRRCSASIRSTLPSPAPASRSSTCRRSTTARPARPSSPAWRTSGAGPGPPPPARHDPDRGQGRRHPRPRRPRVRAAVALDRPNFATLEAEIHSVFGDDGIISPDVKGRSPAWPRPCARAGGRLSARPAVRSCSCSTTRALRDAYRAQVPDVDDRLIFVDVPPSDPDAAVTVVNDPISDAARIRDLVTQGFIVRTRADADTVEARSGDTTRRDAAFASGAQYVSTDYVFPDDHFGTGYVVDLPGTDAARCNPVARPSGASRPTSAADGRALGDIPDADLSPTLDAYCSSKPGPGDRRGGTCPSPSLGLRPGGGRWPSG